MKGSYTGATRVENRDHGCKSREASSKWQLRRCLKHGWRSLGWIGRRESNRKGLGNLREWSAKSLRMQHARTDRTGGEAGEERRADPCRTMSSSQAVPYEQGIHWKTWCKWVLWSVCIFQLLFQHPPWQTLQNCLSTQHLMESILLQGSKLNIGDSMWLARGCPLVICQSQDSNSGLPDSRALPLCCCCCCCFNWLIWIAVGLRCCVKAFSICFEQGYSSLQCEALSLRWLLSLQSTGSRMWASGFVAPRLSCSKAWKIFPDRDRTCVPRIGRLILSHWTTREVLDNLLLTTALCCLDCQAKTLPLFADNPHSNSNDLIFCS